ncbi:PQQ-binding-like beta-propeller repeat protein [Micromonospora sp. CPCC 206060]|uniref:outer membrane protein assembly factor BamB family protein n=1 Tax=Micromonospora sp. CPCC 206060 TaxID=3122406 RepID=UPI002FF2EEE5
MAKGTRWLVLVLAVVVVLAATGVWNPFPTAWDWVNRPTPLSEPDVLWQQRIGGTPRSVTIAGPAVIIEQRTRVESRSLATGTQLWERKADWAAVAGGPSDAVVAVGKLLVKGYEVLDPVTGAVRRRDTKAVAVWTYRNGILDARCTEATDCTLTAWDPRGTTPRWTAYLPGVQSGFLADNPEVRGTRRLTTDRIDPGAAGPEQMPALIGFPADGKVQIVDTATGRVVQDVQPGRQERLVVVGGRLLRIEARSADGTCYFTFVARDPANGVEVWRRTGINPRTADGAGCVQREDPQGGRNVLVGVGSDGRETVLDAYDGRLLWVGRDAEKLLAVDDRYGLVRAGDKRSVASRDLATGRDRWRRPATEKAGAALTPYAAVLADEKPDRLVALHPRTGAELVNLRTQADALAVGPDGMVIGEGRDIGYVRFGAPGGPAPGLDGAPDGGSAPGDGPGDGPGGPAPTCGGPKQEMCPPRDGGKDN